jgi:hypothetical protein
MIRIVGVGAFVLFRLRRGQRSWPRSIAAEFKATGYAPKAS